MTTNRNTDVTAVPHRESFPPLPAIDWKRVGREAPGRTDVEYKGPEAPLPKADIVVITWTSAEWSALDHIFVNSDSSRYHSDRSFEKHWLQYSREAPKVGFSPLWGYYRLTKIKNAKGKELTVLLFKSSSHLAHPPCIQGLEKMMGHIIDDVKPDRIYTIGTAGGSSLAENLGDTCVTNSGHMKLWTEGDSSHPPGCPDNAKNVDYNNKTITCKDWFPNMDLVPQVEKQLLFPMSNVVTNQELVYLLYELHQADPKSADVGLEDLVNAPLTPSNLHSPRGLNKKDIPLLTTDYYYIATGDDAAEYCVLEMDDTVIGHACAEKKVDFAFVRNISDPLVPAKTASGKEISNSIRGDWSGSIYKNFGLYTASNGALITWATIAGDPG